MSIGLQRSFRGGQSGGMAAPTQGCVHKIGSKSPAVLGMVIRGHIHLALQKFFHSNMRH